MLNRNLFELGVLVKDMRDFLKIVRIKYRVDGEKPSTENEQRDVDYFCDVIGDIAAHKA